MKVKGSIFPPAYAIGEQPNMPGCVWIRLTENAVQTANGYEYDEYQLIESDTSGLRGDVAENMATWLELAKATELPVGNSWMIRAEIALTETELLLLDAELALTEYELEEMGE